MTPCTRRLDRLAWNDGGRVITTGASHVGIVVSAWAAGSISTYLSSISHNLHSTGYRRIAVMVIYQRLCRAKVQSYG